VAALEYPDRWGGLADLPPVLDDAIAARLVSVLAGCGEDQVAIRPGAVLGCRLLRAAAPAAGRQPWVPNGTVLVTGGTGGVGGHVARWLAGAGVARLVLASRSGPAAAGIAHRVAALAGAGTAVTVAACDVADREQATALVSLATADGGRLTAVMHAAGTGVGAALDATGPDVLDGLLAAKTCGARILAEATAGLGLEQFVLFSSGAGIWGSGMLGGYAAANAYLDALAAQRYGAGLPALSVAWGLWGGGGMGDGEAGDQLHRLGVKIMDPEAAVAALAAVTGTGGPLAVVADIDWDKFAPVFTIRRASPLIGDLTEAREALAEMGETAGSGAGGELATRLAAMSAAEQERMLTDLVRGHAAAVLGHTSAARVPAGTAFRDLGFDSLTAVELRDKLTAATGLTLPATLVFDHPTPTATATMIRGVLLGDGADGHVATPVFAELDRLESALSRMPEDSDARAGVTARLQAVLSRWLGAQSVPEKEALANQLQAATADEVMDFIDKEFGLS
jgi:acyl carrier protein